MIRKHTYNLSVEWTGNIGKGTSALDVYTRDHQLSGHGKPIILGSSDPCFRGDPNRYNPEELLLAALSACHMLWYLSLCADQGINVQSYSDKPWGEMIEQEAGDGFFTKVLLRPIVRLEDGSFLDAARATHGKASSMCFISASVNFPVLCDPTFLPSLL